VFSLVMCFACAIACYEPVTPARAHNSCNDVRCRTNTIPLQSLCFTVFICLGVLTSHVLPLCHSLIPPVAAYCSAALGPRSRCYLWSSSTSGGAGPEVRP
jgi:hypothetical protein